MAAILAIPAIAVVAALIAFKAKGRRLRAVAVGILVLAFGLVGLSVAKSLAVNRHIDLCMDQTAWYFKENNRFHPDCDNPNVKW